MIIPPLLWNLYSSQLKIRQETYKRGSGHDGTVRYGTGQEAGVSRLYGDWWFLAVPVSVRVSVQPD